MVNKIVQCYAAFWMNFFNFQGRANRTEFWIAWGVNFVISILLDVFFAIIPVVGVLAIRLFTMATLIPSVTLGMRRLHDVDRSGLWMLLIFVPLVGPILLIYWAILEGNFAPNRYGDRSYTGELH